ncbi:hypothetical protein D3C72_1722400 [compost metagenome]
MQPQRQRAGQHRVEIGNRLRGFQRHRIDVATDKAPAVHAAADDRVHAVGADADVEYVDARRHGAAIAGGEQVGKMVDVVGAPRNRRAQVARRQIPEADAVVVRQQRAVQRLDRGRIGKVDTVVAIVVGTHKSGQLRQAGDQRREIIALAMRIARVQTGFAGWFGCGYHEVYRKNNGRIVRGYRAGCRIAGTTPASTVAG